MGSGKVKNIANTTEKNKTVNKIIALAGNPNVGKSTVFNALTGMNQHTGNWPGKTVSQAMGYCTTQEQNYTLVDIPGTYSLMAHSPEEEIARNFICLERPDAVVVVCDATVLERNLNLVLQTMEVSDNVVVCVNLMDEANKKKISVDLEKLSQILGVPVVGCSARRKRTLGELLSKLDEAVSEKSNQNKYIVMYNEVIEEAIEEISNYIKKTVGDSINVRWLALRLLDYDGGLIDEIDTHFNGKLMNNKELNEKLLIAYSKLSDAGISRDRIKDYIISPTVTAAQEIAEEVVRYENEKYNIRDRKLDKVLTGRVIGYPVMIALLFLVFWITITGANYPSELLSDFLFAIEDRLTLLFEYLNAPSWLHGALVLGVYRVLAWVVSVMLPPMAIFFPLFTLLEDSGYLPRIAYNLDKTFKRCCACGKQSLTMCMGFGCNAAGVVGCRIIDSPRERLLAILTNCFVPCNGRFPTMIMIISMFFVASKLGAGTILSSLILSLIIIFGILITFGVTYVLSKTLLKGEPSSFTLELPSYRRPQILKVIVRSIFEKTLSVLARAVATAAPAGLIIWLMANVTVGGESILHICAGFLDPFAQLMGLDGIILMAFILGLPANEIVIPIAVMGYMAQGSMQSVTDLVFLKELLVSNGWTVMTAVSVILFSLIHWPCATTILTIKKETGSLKWTLLAIVIPTVLGIFLCIALNFVARLIM